LRGKDIPLIPLLIVIVVVLGMAISFAPEPYHHDITFERDGDVVHYSHHSTTGSPTRTVAFTVTGDFFIEKVVLYFDESYASLTSIPLQKEVIRDMLDQLRIRGIDSICCNAKEMLEVIRTYDPGTTALFFASGALPDILYDGTAGCPIVDWLDRGGVLINESGCLGKYVSHGPDKDDIEQVIGYGDLFAGVDDASFNDSKVRMYATGGCDEAIRDSLNFYMNEYTFGIDITGFSDAKNLGYVSDDGYSSAVMFKSRGGMVINFGVSITNHSHFDHFVAQMIASGMDYSSEMFYSHAGNTRGDNSGDIDLIGGPCVIYGHIGSPRAVYGERILITS